METKKEILDRVNDFKGSINSERTQIDSFIDAIKKRTGVSLPNFINIYRDKIFDFEDLFREKGIEYFSKDCYLRVITSIYFDYVHVKLYKKMISIARTADRFNNINRAFIPLYNNIILYKIKQLNSDIRGIKDFNIDKLPKVFESMMNNYNLFAPFMPDCYQTFTDEILHEFKLLDVNIDSIDMDKLNKTIQKNKKNALLNIEISSLEERIEVFKDFITGRDFDIKSEYLDKDYHLELKK